MEIWDDAPAAPALVRVNERNIAVVTTSGVVPWGNPDKFKTYRNTYWRKYNIAELKELEPGKWEAVHGGYNVAFMNQNPHYGVPLDALRSLEAEGAIGAGKLYPAYYVIPGNQGSPTVMRRIGQEIAADQDLSIRLNRQTIDRAACTGPGVEGGIEAPVRIEPGNSIAGLAPHTGESASNDDLPVRLHTHTIHERGGTWRTECAVHTPVRVEARDVVAGLAAYGGKGSADDDAR